MFSGDTPQNDQQTSQSLTVLSFCARALDEVDCSDWTGSCEVRPAKEIAGNKTWRTCYSEKLTGNFSQCPIPTIFAQKTWNDLNYHEKPTKSNQPNISNRWRSNVPVPVLLVAPRPPPVGRGAPRTPGLAGKQWQITRWVNDDFPMKVTILSLWPPAFSIRYQKVNLIILDWLYQTSTIRMNLNRSHGFQCKNTSTITLVT